jgi:short-subunit dehydrogenase
MDDLRGSCAVVTGGSRGIGTVIAGALAGEGVNLVLAAPDADPLEAVARRLVRPGVQVIPAPTDITRADERAALVATTLARFNRIDFLINNAAIIEWTSFVDQDPQPLSSLEGKVGIPHTATYGATKAALLLWNAALRSELDGTGVGTTAVVPGYVTEVGMWAAWGIPAPRLGGVVSPERVAHAVLRALRKNPQEVIVRSTPTRPLLALTALWPELAGQLLKAIGIDQQMKRLITR